MHTPSGLRAIESLNAGEEIWALDPITLKWTVAKVAQRWAHEYRGELTEIAVNGRKLTATGHHPFWVVAGSDLQSRTEPRHCEAKEAVATPTLTGRWVEARDLRPGDVIVVRTSDGFAKIEAIRTWHSEQVVYNLEVEGLHTFAVGKDGVWVHNPKYDVYVLKLKGKIVYVGIAKLSAKLRLPDHKIKKKGRFDEMVVIAQGLGGRRAARNIEGSALHHIAKADIPTNAVAGTTRGLMLNEIRKTPPGKPFGGFYHQYNPGDPKRKIIGKHKIEAILKQSLAVFKP